MTEETIVKSPFKAKLWSISAYVKPGLLIYFLLWLNFFLTLIYVMPRWNVRPTNNWDEGIILLYIFLPLISFILASEVVTKLVMIIRSKKLYNRNRIFSTTIGVDQDSEKKVIEEVRDEETNKLLIPRSILCNKDGLSPWKIRGNSFAIIPEGTIVTDGVVEEIMGGDYSEYKAWQLPHPALTEHLYRTEVEMGSDGNVTKKIIPIMPNFNYKESSIWWSPLGWDGNNGKQIGVGCPHALLRWQNDRITKLEDEIRYWRQIKEKTVVVVKEGMEQRQGELTA